MLTDIQIPKTLLTPFHRLFLSWNSKPSLEQVLVENKAGGRGKSAKRAKRPREGGSFSWLIRKFSECWWLSVSSAWVFAVLREAQGTRVVFLLRVWRGEKYLCPFYEGSEYCLLFSTITVLNFSFKLFQFWLNWSATHVKEGCSECLYIYIHMTDKCMHYTYKYFTIPHQYHCIYTIVLLVHR